MTLFALAWIVILFVSGGGVPVGTFDAPLLGPVPMPLALLTASVLVSAALGWRSGSTPAGSAVASLPVLRPAPSSPCVSRSSIRRSPGWIGWNRLVAPSLPRGNPPFS